MPGASITGGFEPRTNPAERRDFFDLRRLIRGRMRWLGGWDAGQEYAPGDVVSDEGWTMICADPNGCTEKPAPQPVGEPSYVYQGASPTSSDLQAQIIFGNRYAVAQGGYLVGYRVFTVADSSYTVYSITDPDGINEIEQLITFIGKGGWEEFSVSPVIVPASLVFEVLALVREPDPTPTTWTGVWDYQTPNNEGIPGPGDILHASRLSGSFRISKTDDNGGDRGAELLALNNGDTIEGPTVTWAIQNVSDEGTWADIAVAPTTRDVPGVATFTFATVTATAIEYMVDTGYWPTNVPSVSGVFGTTTDNVALDTNAYGTDILVQGATVSDEWEAVSAPSEGSAGGGTSAAVWTDLSADAPTMAADWELLDWDAWRSSDDMLQFRLVANRITSAITVPPSGDIGNVTVATLTTSCRGTLNLYLPVYGGYTGRVAMGGFIPFNGALQLSAVGGGGADIAIGDDITLGGMVYLG